MPKSLKSILVPVDLSINTELAVKKALELADNRTTIHLLYVHNYYNSGLGNAIKSVFSNSYKMVELELIKGKLKQWKSTIEEFSDYLSVYTWTITGGTIQKEIEKMAKRLAVELIIIGKNSSHSRLPVLNTVLPAKIVQHTGIAVLTVKPSAIHHKTRTMVLPITNEAVYKLEVLSTICRKFNVKIYLVTFMTDENELLDYTTTRVMQAYQWLKDSTHCRVEYAVLKGSDKMKATVKYAEKINADMLMVPVEIKNKDGWLNKRVINLLSPAYRLQILTILSSATLN